MNDENGPEGATEAAAKIYDAQSIGQALRMCGAAVSGSPVGSNNGNARMVFLSS